MAVDLLVETSDFSAEMLDRTGIAALQ